MIEFFYELAADGLDFLLTFATFFISAAIFHWFIIRLQIQFLSKLDIIFPLLYLGACVLTWSELWQLADGELSSLWDVFRQQLFDVADDVHDYVQHLRHLSAPGSIALHTLEIIFTVAFAHFLFFPLFYLWGLLSAPLNFKTVLTYPLQFFVWSDITLILYLCIRLNNIEEFSLRVTIIFLITRVYAWFQERKHLKSA